MNITEVSASVCLLYIPGFLLGLSNLFQMETELMHFSTTRHQV